MEYPAAGVSGQCMSHRLYFARVSDLLLPAAVVQIVGTRIACTTTIQSWSMPIATRKGHLKSHALSKCTCPPLQRRTEERSVSSHVCRIGPSPFSVSYCNCVSVALQQCICMLTVDHNQLQCIRKRGHGWTATMYMHVRVKVEMKSATTFFKLTCPCTHINASMVGGDGRDAAGATPAFALFGPCRWWQLQSSHGFERWACLWPERQQCTVPCATRGHGDDTGTNGNATCAPSRGRGHVSLAALARVRLAAEAACHGAPGAFCL